MTVNLSPGARASGLLLLLNGDPRRGLAVEGRVSRAAVGRHLVTPLAAPLSSAMPLSVVLWPYAVMSLVSLAAFARDKRAAATGRRRIRERTLHTLSLLGGWPGALVAMRVVRHKRRKGRFVAVTWGIAGLHAGVWVCAAATAW